MIKKLVLIRYEQIRENTFIFFCITDLLKHGIIIDYLDVSAITSRVEYKTTDAIQKADITILSIKSYQELSNYILKQDIRTTLFVPFMTYFNKTFRCFRLLSRYDCIVAYCSTGLLPDIAKKKMLCSIK